MRIKKFEATSFREALALVKKELGRDAVILSSEEIRGPKPKVEVLAAVDPDLESLGTVSGEGEKTEQEEMTVRPDRVLISSFSREKRQRSEGTCTHALLNEIIHLKESLESLKSKGYQISLPEQKKRVYRILRERAIREDLALELSEQAEGPEDLPALLRRDLQCRWEWSAGRIVLLVGSTGVGKTTTAAKLCGQAIKRQKKVGLISLDTYRIGAIEQIRIYSNILGVPLVIAASATEVFKGVQKMNDRDLILIDTTGRNPRDPAYIQDLQRICALELPLEIHLLMSGSSSESFMADAWSRYRDLPLNRIAFTKMDEAEGFGPLYNFARLARLPIAYVTNGQKVPNDIAFYSEDELVDGILNRESNPAVLTTLNIH